MPLDETSIAGYVARTGRVVNVADAYRLPEGSPFRISRSFDEKSGYRTKSMLVVPMRDHENVVIGVVQLINKKRDRAAVLQPVALVEEEVVPFTSVDEELVELARQPGRGGLRERGPHPADPTTSSTTFVHAAVTAIEQRDPPTSGHSEPRGRAHRRPRREGGRHLLGTPRRRAASPATSSRSCATRRSCTTSARSAVQEKVLGKRKKLYADADDRGPAALRLHPRRPSRPSTCGRGSRRSTSGRASPESLAALDAEYRVERRGDRADARGGAPRRTSRRWSRRRASASS